MKFGRKFSIIFSLSFENMTLVKFAMSLAIVFQWKCCLLDSMRRETPGWSNCSWYHSIYLVWSSMGITTLYFFWPKTFFPHRDANVVPTHCSNGGRKFEVNSKVANDISSNDDIILFSVLFGSVVYLEIVNKVTMRSKFNQLVTKFDGCSGGKWSAMSFHRVDPYSSFWSLHLSVSFRIVS